MAIISPADLPAVLRVASDPMKSYVLTMLGHPSVDVELSESQWEIILRTSGDFIAGYFPREQRFAWFMTNPLQTTYAMPKDAYWIEEVQWDPVTTNAGDIFGAESYLFCFAENTKLLTEHGPMPCEEVQHTGARLVTPYGPKRARLRWNPIRQPVQVLAAGGDYVGCTTNHQVFMSGAFRASGEAVPGATLLGVDGVCHLIEAADRASVRGTWSVSSPVGCFYASTVGEKFFLVH